MSSKSTLPKSIPHATVRMCDDVRREADAIDPARVARLRAEVAELESRLEAHRREVRLQAYQDEARDRLARARAADHGFRGVNTPLGADVVTQARSDEARDAHLARMQKLNQRRG